jgi:hypothetical protein
MGFSYKFSRHWVCMGAIDKLESFYDAVKKVAKLNASAAASAFLSAFFQAIALYIAIRIAPT